MVYGVQRVLRIMQASQSMLQASELNRAVAYTVLYTEGYHWFKNGCHNLVCGLASNVLRINTLRRRWRLEAELKNIAFSHFKLHRGAVGFTISLFFFISQFLVRMAVLLLSHRHSTLRHDANALPPYKLSSSRRTCCYRKPVADT